jgi:acyl-CoA synthetase (AMP-forming)/AMP-acid ligase II
MQLGTLLTRHARYSPDRLAVVCGDARLTFCSFNRKVNQLANALLGAGIGKGDNIACVLPNGLEILTLYWAAAKIGAVVVPLSPLLTAVGLASLVDHSDAVMIFVGTGTVRDIDSIKSKLTKIAAAGFVFAGPALPGYVTFDEFVRDASDAEPPHIEIGDQDPLMIVYSSGTTGEPKGIMLSHYVRAMYCTLYGAAWRMTPESVSLHAGSLVFNGAFMTLLPSFFLGGKYILHHHFDPVEVIATIERERVTHIVMVPSQIISLLEHSRLTAERLKSLQAVISLGATLHLPHKQRLTELLPGRFYEMYGLAEGFMTILDKSDPVEKLGSVGCPPPFFEMRIIGEDGCDAPTGSIGEIVGRGPILMTGYYRRPDLTAKAIVDGWLYSGDLGYVDADGYLYLADRKKDMIKSGGVNVYPSDIEQIIVGNPAVAEAAVFGVPHEKWGECPIVAVVLAGQARITPGELKDWINSRVAAKFQRVSDVVVVDALPRNAAGKTVKRELQMQYLGRHEARATAAS